MEAMVAIVLFLVVVLTVGSIYIMSQRVNRQGSNIMELTQNARVCLDRMSRDLRQAANIVTELSTTTPTNEIFFQDGHNSDEITYIKYYLDGTDLKREHLAYYFSSDPGIYVYYNDVDSLGNPPEKTILGDRIIGEYFSKLDFYGGDDLIEIWLNLNKDEFSSTFNTTIYTRNQN